MSETEQDRPGPEELGAHLRELSGLLSGRSGPPDPERLVSFAARAVQHGEHCGLTLTRGSSRPVTLAGSGEVVRQVDALQYDAGEGPCLDAVEGHDLVRVDDLAGDETWPKFARRCVGEAGIRSMFSVRLFLSSDDRAALNFYATEPGAFDDLDVGTGAVLAPFAELAVQSMLHEHEVGHLRTALQGSRQIGTAVGILMARELVTSEQAFAQLVASSQNLNRKLRDIAVEVEETGSLPEPAPKPGPARDARRRRR